MRGTVFLIALFWAAVASAADYRIVPSGDPSLPYRVEPVNPLPSTDVATFDQAVAEARRLEGLTAPVITLTVGDDAETATATGICADKAGVIQPCENLPVGIE